MYGAAALGAFVLYKKSKAAPVAAPAAAVEPSYVVPTGSTGGGGTTVLATPQASFPYVSAPVYVTPNTYNNAVQTPYGTVIPSFTNQGAGSNADGTVSPPVAAVGDLVVSVGKDPRNMTAAPGVILLEGKVSGGVNKTYIYTWTFPEAVNPAQGVRSGVPKDYTTTDNWDRIWYDTNGLTLPRVITLSVYSDPARGGNGKRGSGSFTLSGV